MHVEALTPPLIPGLILLSIPANQVLLLGDKSLDDDENK